MGKSCWSWSAGLWGYMEDVSESGNDQCILSHSQLFWHLGIYVLRHIFMGFRQRSAVASRAYLTYRMDRNSCEAVKWLGCERESRTFVCFDTSQLFESASSSCATTSLFMGKWICLHCAVAVSSCSLVGSSLAVWHLCGKGEQSGWLYQQP